MKPYWHLKNMAFKTEPGDIPADHLRRSWCSIPDTDDEWIGKKTETDGFDESWVTYSGFLLDDELYAAYAGFKEGVRILVVSDSCHSGTMLRAMICFPHGWRPWKQKKVSDSGMYHWNLSGRYWLDKVACAP